MTSRPITLDDVRAAHVVVECRTCNRQGSYATSRLKHTYGGHIMLPDLKDKIAVCKARSSMGGCSARYSAETVASWQPVGETPL